MSPLLLLPIGTTNLVSTQMGISKFVVQICFSKLVQSNLYHQIGSKSAMYMVLK